MNCEQPRFGTDVDGQLKDWWRGEGIDELRKRFGPEVNIYFGVLDPAMADIFDCEFPLEELLHSLDTRQASQAEGVTVDDDYFFGETGLQANVDGKLAFVLRTGLDSSEAQTRADLVEPGDFPMAGAGTYRGYKGGVSGLAAADDWIVFCWIVDKVIQLRAAAAQAAISACKNRDPNAGADIKYLGRRESRDAIVGVDAA
jgi:hypothetical protein